MQTEMRFYTPCIHLDMHFIFNTTHSSFSTFEISRIDVFGFTVQNIKPTSYFFIGNVTYFQTRQHHCFQMKFTNMSWKRPTKPFDTIVFRHFLIWPVPTMHRFFVPLQCIYGHRDNNAVLLFSQNWHAVAVGVDQCTGICLCYTVHGCNHGVGRCPFCYT